jgi:hypothetical protein
MQTTNPLTSSDTVVEIPVHQDQIRVLVDPVEPKAKSRAIACIAVQDLHDSGIGEWLEANVRFQKMNSSIAKDILKTLDERPENMHPLNRGLTVLANGFRYDSQTHKLLIQLRDPKRHGIIDGGHTFRALQTVAKDRLDAGLEPPKAFVNMEVLAGYDDIASDIISARNSVCAVRSSAIYALDGVFQDLRQSLAKAQMEQLVAFKQNDLDKPMTVEEVIAISYLFHPAFAEGNTHPTKAYSSRASCVETYAEEWTLIKEAKDSTRWKQGFGKIVHLVPEFLRLTEEIEAEIDATYRSGGGLKGLLNDESESTKEGKEKGKKLKELSGPRDLPITGKHIKSGWPTGYLYPIVGALRPLVDYSGDVAKWKVAEPLAIFDTVKIQLVKKLLAFADEFGRKPNAVGKNQLCWSSLYDTVENACLRELAKSQS